MFTDSKIASPQAPPSHDVLASNVSTVASTFIHKRRSTVIMEEGTKSEHHKSTHSNDLPRREQTQRNISATTMELALGGEKNELHFGTYCGETKYGQANGNGTWKIHNVCENYTKEYVGEWKDNIPHGKGIDIYGSGARYEGELQNGKRHGQGRYYWADGDCYDGEWKEDNRHGRGCFYRANGDLQYDGDWVESEEHGHGICNYADGGGRYDGQLNHRKRHGHGIFHYMDGAKYDGEWKDGHRHGHGIFHHTDGSHYEGQWKYGMEQGHGVYHFANGNRYDGEWLDGKKHGRGTYSYANGERYEGEFQNDKGCGKGVYYLKKGKYHGEWMDGRKISPFQLWMQDVNGGEKTTLKQQFQLAFKLYETACPNMSHQITTDEVITMVENTPIGDSNSIVSWTGIKVEWFLEVFCKSPFIKVLIEYGCEVWFIRKVCVIEIIRQAAYFSKEEQTYATFVDNVHLIIKGLGLKGGKEITSKPTTFLSYTGHYTMEHLTTVLANLDPQEYIWMDIFCVNQFAWTGKGQSPEMRQFRNTFMDDLQNQIGAIGSTALILEKWDNVMLTLSQMWVLWEIFNTARSKADLKVLLTPEQKTSFISNCLLRNKEFENIQASLATIDANNAVTDDDIDRQFIFDRMQSDDNGFVQVNTTISEVMRNWLAQEGIQYLDYIRAKGHAPTGVFLSNLGVLLQEQGRLDEAEKLLREGLAVNQQSFGTQHPDCLLPISCLGNVLHLQNKTDEAEPLCREALKTSREILGDQHPNTHALIHNLASLLQHQGKLDEAESLCREDLEIRQKDLGDQHPGTVTSMNSLGNLLHRQGKMEEAEPLLREAFKISRQVLGDRHSETLSTMNNLGILLKKLGKFDEAESLMRAALGAQRQVLGDQNEKTLTSLINLGSLLYEKGQLDKAEPLFIEALENSRQMMGDQHPETLTSINNLGQLLKDQGKLDESGPLLREAVETSCQVLGDQHPHTLISMINLGDLLQRQGELDSAEILFREALGTRKQVLGNQHPDTLISMINLGSLLIDQDKAIFSMASFGSLIPNQEKIDEAESLLRDALSTSRRVLGDQHPITQTSIVYLGQVLGQKAMRYVINQGPHLLVVGAFFVAGIFLCWRRNGESCTRRK